MPAEQSTKKKILFVCTGNTCRSVMAAALARQAVDELAMERLEIEILSAGLAAFPGDLASRGAIKAMRKKGVDISAHRSSALTPVDIQDADLVLAMTSAHKEALCRMFPSCARKIHTLAQYAGASGDVPDPFGQPDKVYLQVADLLERLVIQAIRRLGKETVPGDKS